VPPSPAGKEGTRTHDLPLRLLEADSGELPPAEHDRRLCQIIWVWESDTMPDLVGHGADAAGTHGDHEVTVGDHVLQRRGQRLHVLDEYRAKW